MTAMTAIAEVEQLPQPIQQPTQGRMLPDPAQLWLVFRRRIGWFLLAALITMALVAAYTLTRPTLYTTTATVQLEPRMPEAVKDVDSAAPKMGADTNVIDTEVQILSSPRLAGRVAESLSAKYPQFRTPPGDIAAGPGTHPRAAALLGAVTVRRSGLTFLINIQATAREPQLAADIANGFAREYLAQQAQTKNMTAAEAQAFVDGRLDQLRSEVVAADAAVQNYKINNGLMSAEGATMAEQEVSTLNQQIAEARALLAEKTGQIEASRGNIGSGSSGADLPAALQSGTVATLRAREAELSGKLADLQSNYGELHPELRRVRDELADTRQQLQRQINRVVASLEADVQAARFRLNSLLASQGQARGSLANSNTAQIGFFELERKALAARTIYEAYLKRSHEMISQEGLLRPDARIETLARQPSSPSSPNYLLALVVGLGGGLIAGLAAMMLAEYFDARLRTRADVEQRLQVKYAGAIPDLFAVAPDEDGLGPADYIVARPFSAFAEAFRSLKSALLLGSGSRSRAIAITSALPREGKTSTAICLARTTALSGLRTVLVDCDARRRSASDALLPEGAAGLTDYLNRGVSLEQSVWLDEASGLHVLGSRQAPPQGSDLFRGNQWPELLEELRRHYDVILIDTAPVLGIAETRDVAARADTTLLLGRWRQTPIKAADTTIDLLLDAGVNLFGMALSMVDTRKYASTGQEDVYHYHRQFAGYYAN